MGPIPGEGKDEDRVRPGQGDKTRSEVILGEGPAHTLGTLKMRCNDTSEEF